MVANIATPPKLQFFDSSGNPLSGGLLWTYAAGTTTPLASYTDQTGSVANANPVVLNSRGEASVWLSSAMYKMTLQTSAGVEIWTVDNLNGAQQNVLSTLAAAGGSALIGYTPAGSSVNVQTVQTKLQDIVNINDYTTSAAYDTARNALSGRNDMVVRPVNESTDLLLSAALNQTRPPVYHNRSAPNSNFDWFISQFGVPRCQGPGQASAAYDINAVWDNAYAALKPSGALYVAPWGSDSNSGAGWSTAFATINKGLNSLGGGIVYVWPGTYNEAYVSFNGPSTGSASPNGDKPKKLIAPYGNVTLTVGGDDISAATWTSVGGSTPNVYSTVLTTSNQVSRVMLANALDEYGLPTPLPIANSVATVDSSGLGWWWDSSGSKTLYLRVGAQNINTYTAIKSNLRASYTNAANTLRVWNTILYIEGITIDGNVIAYNSAGALPEIWMKDCTVRYSNNYNAYVSGGGKLYTQGCFFYRPMYDNLNYNSSGADQCYGVEINNTCAYAGDVDTYGYGPTQPYNPSVDANKNASSNHNGIVVRINGDYSKCFGPVIADALTTGSMYSWNLGVNMGTGYGTAGSNSGFTFASSSGNSWLDSCGISANILFNAGISNLSGTMYRYNTPATTSGTVTDYIPGYTA